jgi:hypothetical protein
LLDKFFKSEPDPVRAIQTLKEIRNIVGWNERFSYHNHSYHNTCCDALVIHNPAKLDLSNER